MFLYFHRSVVNGHGQPMTLSQSRRIAFDILRRVEAEGAYASDLLHGELGPGVTRKDAALATELAMGVLRWRGLLDFLLERHLKKPIARLDLAVALALRMGIYQIRFLTRIPASAAVNESVELARLGRKASAAPLVNAVLRKVSAESGVPADQFLPYGQTSAERLSILHSHPAWMVGRWISRHGEARTTALLEANNRALKISCAWNGPQNREEIARELERDGLAVSNGQFLKTAFTVTGGNVARTNAFRAGKFSILDEASQAIPLLLDVQPSGRILDLCAAPGGKTPPLVRAAGCAGIVVATDRHAHRLRAMSKQLERLGLLRRVHLVELDASLPLPFRAPFDRILVDAPCSGTGTLARHPEIRWRLQPERLAELHVLQTQILAMAIQSLARGGRLLYSTCSLEPEENEDVITEALKSANSIRRVSAGEIAPALARHLSLESGAVRLFDEAGQFRTFPGEQPTDGFFAAMLEKK